MIISDDDYFNSPLNSPVSGAGLIIIFKILQRLSSRRSASAQFLGRSFVATTTFAKTHHHPSSPPGHHLRSTVDSLFTKGVVAGGERALKRQLASGLDPV